MRGLAQANAGSAEIALWSWKGLAVGWVQEQRLGSSTAESEQPENECGAQLSWRVDAKHHAG